MSTDINSVVVTGRLTRDAELTHSGGGLAICKFSIASNYSTKHGDDWKEEVSYFDAVLLGKRGDALAKYLVKGKPVTIAGALRQNRWEQDGQKRSRVEIIVGDVVLGGGEKRAPDGTQPGDRVDDGEVPF
jgi:single-strand DNA-binding protein